MTERQKWWLFELAYLVLLIGVAVGLRSGTFSRGHANWTEIAYQARAYAYDTSGMTSLSQIAAVPVLDSDGAVGRFERRPKGDHQLWSAMRSFGKGAGRKPPELEDPSTFPVLLHCVGTSAGDDLRLFSQATADSSIPWQRGRSALPVLASLLCALVLYGGCRLLASRPFAFAGGLFATLTPVDLVCSHMILPTTTASLLLSGAMVSALLALGAATFVRSLPWIASAALCGLGMIAIRPSDYWVVVGNLAVLSVCLLCAKRWSGAMASLIGLGTVALMSPIDPNDGLPNIADWLVSLADSLRVLVRDHPHYVLAPVLAPAVWKRVEVRYLASVFLIGWAAVAANDGVGDYSGLDYRHFLPLHGAILLTFVPSFEQLIAGKAAWAKALMASGVLAIVALGISRALSTLEQGHFYYS